jgi:glutathione synthase/RimK-type ligase-like ATP-grasp enzyme
VIWWRRSAVYQQIPEDVTERASIDVINNDCRFAMFGVLFNEFTGEWISEPQATHNAENKLVQIRVAEQLGFRTPRTLVSQDVDEIREFCRHLDSRVVVKVVRGAKRAALLTTLMNGAALQEGDSIRLCPTMYQELIPGTRHIRACCFGDSVYAAQLDSPDLDWRCNLNIPVTVLELSDSVKSRLFAVLKALGLKMGIFDLKFDENEEPVWLEVNPQGQFLFLEGLCGLPLTAAFSDFLYQNALGVHSLYREGDRSA